MYCPTYTIINTDIHRLKTGKFLVQLNTLSRLHSLPMYIMKREIFKPLSIPTTLYLSSTITFKCAMSPPSF